MTSQTQNPITRAADAVADALPALPPSARPAAHAFISLLESHEPKPDRNANRRDSLKTHKRQNRPQLTVIE